VKIGIVNDMPMAVEALRRALLASDRHQVVWTAENGAVAVARAAENPPDLILMDLIMPVMDGVEATRRIMRTSPCNILVVTASVSGNSGKVFEAMGAGALDVVATPVMGGRNNGAMALLQKIDRIARISGKSAGPAAKPAATASPAQRREVEKHCLVAIGSSTGGPQALLRILRHLPADLRASVVVIQHMDEQFAGGLAEWLDNQVRIRVRVLENGERPRQGTVLIPATGNHVVMTPSNNLSYSADPRDNFYHPSVDVFFKSVARYWHGNCIGIILTGMGRDGAEGLLALRRNNHYSIAQDRESCVVYGMPKAAVEVGAVCEVLPLDAIGSRINELLNPQRGLCNHE